MTEKVRKTCVFCGNTGSKFTKEHVFPNWINQVLGLSDKIEAMHFDQHGGQRNWTMNRLDQKVKVVCEQCNGGWMSQELEVPVNPLLTPMLLGRVQHANLGRERQTLIAGWALKTAMMIEHIFPRDLSFPTSDYTYLYEHRQPPPGTLVLLSAHQPPIGSHGLLVATSKHADVRSLIRDKAGKPLADVPEPYRAGVVMFAIQHFVATVFSHNFPAELDVGVFPPRPGLQFEDYFQQAWPIAHKRLRWPPSDLNEVGGFEGTFDAWRGVG